MQPANVNYIPSSLDMLAYNGILTYDPTAYIYDRKSALPMRYSAPRVNKANADAFNNKKRPSGKFQKNAKILGAVAAVLGSAALVAAALKGKLNNVKLPKSFTEVKSGIGKTFGEIKKAFKKAPKKVK